MLLTENFQFQGFRVGKEKITFTFKDIEKHDIVLSYLPFEDVLFAEFVKILDRFSMLMLGFEEVIPDWVLIDEGFNYEMFGQDEIAIDVNEAQKAYYKGYSPRANHLAVSLNLRLSVKSVSCNDDLTIMRIKAERFRNIATLREQSNNDTLFAPAEKGTSVNYAPIALQTGAKGVSFAFAPALDREFQEVGKIAFKCLRSMIRQYIPFVDSLDFDEQMELQLNQGGEALSDNEQKGTKENPIIIKVGKSINE